MSSKLHPSLRRASGWLLAGAIAALGTPAFASSHREAPFIASQPQVDATDFYMFRSYEPGRAGYVTIVRISSSSIPTRCTRSTSATMAARPRT